MNLKTAIFIVNPSTRCIKVSYQDGNFQFAKTINPHIKVDDLVVIPTSTRHGFTVVKVVEVDVLFNLAGTGDMAWVHQIVDKDGYENLVEQEKKILETVQKADMRRERAQMAETLIKDGLTPEDFAGLSLVTAPALTAPTPAPKSE